MNKNDSYKKAEALRKALRLQNLNYAPDQLSLRVSNERYAEDANFELRLSFKDKQLLKEMGIAV